jgi:nitrite reductase/ring-hydroxylating ferredoxin subunit
MSAAKSVLLCKASDLAPGSVRRIEHPDGPAIAVYNVEGTFYATDDNCTHGLSSLAEGMLDGDMIECAAHFGGFDVKTGKAVMAPCSIDLKTYKVEVRGDEVFAVLAAA